MPSDASTRPVLGCLIEGCKHLGTRVCGIPVREIGRRAGEHNSLSEIQKKVTNFGYYLVTPQDSQGLCRDVIWIIWGLHKD